ncbi:MAG: hypothetical protein HKO02_07735 [Hyphomonadaceae bacterium]|nr:hypothetical protein [Hyphomonadaceae bacterium]
MKCPVDDFTLTEESYEGYFKIDRCPSCWGVWLDPGELDKIQRLTILDYSEELAKPENDVARAFALAKSKQEGTYKCVKCASDLVKKEYGFNSQIQIDTCPKGCGMWLDAGELEALEQFYERLQPDKVGRVQSILDFIDSIRR